MTRILTVLRTSKICTTLNFSKKKNAGLGVPAFQETECRDSQKVLRLFTTRYGNNNFCLTQNDISFNQSDIRQRAIQPDLRIPTPMDEVKLIVR